MGLLGLRVDLFLVFKGTSLLFSLGVVPIYISTKRVKELLFLHTLSSIYYLWGLTSKICKQFIVQHHSMSSWYVKSSWFSNLVEKEKHCCTSSLKIFNCCLSKLVPLAWLSLNSSQEKIFSTIYLILVKIWDSPMNTSVKMPEENNDVKDQPRLTSKFSTMGPGVGDRCGFWLVLIWSFFYESLPSTVIKQLYVSGVKLYANCSATGTVGIHLKCSGWSSCTPMADSYQCMPKPIQYCKVK